MLIANAVANNDNPVEQNIDQDNIKNDDTQENMPTDHLNETVTGDNRDSEDEPLVNVQNKLRKEA